MPSPAPKQPIKPPADLERYSRQILYQNIGRSGQEKLRSARVVLIGCGALGTALANTLARSGVGYLRIIDRDFVELNNLQRQVLFDEQDVAEAAPKAVAAARHLKEINSTITVEPVVADANWTNIESLIESAQLILDGTDNFETRYLINDAAVKGQVPWIYGACIGAEGMVMPIIPGRTPCLRCIFDQPPPPGISPTCDTAGVIGPIVQVVAARQAVEAIKLLTGRFDDLNRHLVQINLWTGELGRFDMQRAFEEGDCPCCKGANYAYLSGEQTGRAVSLCGRDAVQIRSSSDRPIDLASISERIKTVATTAPILNQYLLRFEVDSFNITLFHDGRAIIKGTAVPEEARTIYAKYIGI